MKIIPPLMEEVMETQLAELCEEDAAVVRATMGAIDRLTYASVKMIERRDIETVRKMAKQLSAFCYQMSSAFLAVADADMTDEMVLERLNQLFEVA